MVQHHLRVKGLPTHKHSNTQQNAGGLALYYNYRLLLQIWNTLTHCVTSQLGAKQCICSLLIGQFFVQVLLSHLSCIRDVLCCGVQVMKGPCFLIITVG